MSNSKNNILITICARGGSKGIKGKNLRMLGGKPLIAYTIQQAIAWGHADHVVVSTDSKQIAKVAIDYGAEVPFMRPKELATDEAGKIPVLRHALSQCERIYNKEFQIIVDLDPTSPVRSLKDIDLALKKFKRLGVKTLFSVIRAHKSPYFTMVERNKHGMYELSKKPPRPIVRRQDAPIVYDLNASFYVYKPEYLRSPSSMTPISDNSGIYVVDDWASIDIDREIDFRFIEFLVKEHIITL